MSIKSLKYLPKKTLNGKTLLVTGGAGFIGSNFVRQTLAAYPTVRIVCVDLLTYAGNRDNLKGFPKKRFTFIKGDIADREFILRVFKKYSPAYIVNFAAESHVDRSIHRGVEAFVRTNTLGTAVLLEQARHIRTLRKFVQVSTDEVYGALPQRSKRLFNEQSPLAPNSPYAASKAAADLIARSFFMTYGLPVVTTRCSNNYGPYQHPEKFIPHSITQLLKNKPAALYGDGLYVRDWIHVEDHCDALILSLLHGVPGDVYNIGARDEASNIALSRRILRYFKKDDSFIQYVKDRPGHDRRYAVDSSKIKKVLGWSPKYLLRTSLGPTIDWYVKNSGWVSRALLHGGSANTHISAGRKLKL